LVDGRPKDTNHDTYTPLRMGDVPDVEVEFLPSTEMPVGRPPRWSANAIFVACGARLRHLPIRPEAALQAVNPRA
jgi:isoquinoline 1-oxidoreductase subunit beta